MTQNELPHKEGRHTYKPSAYDNKQNMCTQTIKLFFENSLIKGTLVLVYNKYPLYKETFLVKCICLHWKKRVINVLALFHSVSFV